MIKINIEGVERHAEIEEIYFLYSDKSIHLIIALLEWLEEHEESPE